MRRRSPSQEGREPYRDKCEDLWDLTSDGGGEDGPIAVPDQKDALNMR